MPIRPTRAAARPRERRQDHVSKTSFTVAFIAGTVGLVLYAIVEGIVFLLCHLQPCQAVEHQVPWGLLLTCFVLIMPETLGRNRAAAIVSRGLDLLVLRLTGKGPATAAIVAAQPDGGEKTVATAELPAGTEGSQTVVARPDIPEG